jgi:hypothetical protein
MFLCCHSFFTTQAADESKTMSLGENVSALKELEDTKESARYKTGNVNRSHILRCLVGHSEENERSYPPDLRVGPATLDRLRIEIGFVGKANMFLE